MTCLKTSIFITFTSFIIALESFSPAPNDLYNNDEINGLFGWGFESEDRMDIIPSNNENDQCNLGEIGNLNEVHPGYRAITSRETAQHIAFNEPIDPICTDQTNLMIPNLDSTKPSPEDNNSDALKLSGQDATLNNQGLITLPYSVQAHQTHQNQSSEDNNDDRSHSHSRSRSRSRSQIYRGSHTATPSNALPALTKISKVGLNLREKIRNNNFCVPRNPKLLYQRAFPGNSQGPKFLFRAEVYGTFFRNSGRIHYTRTGKPDLYIRITDTIVSLFEMKPGFNPPKSFYSRTMLELNSVEATFEHAKWSIQLGIPHKIVKVGIDPSKVMTLWTITNEKVDKIDLSDRKVSRHLSLQRGDILVAIPSQLNGLMRSVKKGTSYNEFLPLIRRFTDFSLDQLILILET